MLRLMCFLILGVCCFGQLDPDGAHVDLYFPHLADGGPAADQWQTSFVFVNPHPSLPAIVFLFTYGNDGQPLSLDLGSGGTSLQILAIPASGSRTVRSTIASPTTVTGYAYAGANLPLQATVLFRRIINGVPQVEVSAPATLPSPEYFSPATRDLAVALVNIYSVARSFQITALDSNGLTAGTSTINLGPREHTSFNLSQRMPSLPAGFSGSVRIFPLTTPIDQFLAWTLNVDRGLIATLPPGRLSWPIDHVDRIWLVYNKLLATAPSTLTSMGITGVNLNTTGAVNLVISADQIINAFARPGVVQINLSISQLISDSPSELAFAVAHELGHIAQFQRGRTLLISNAEQDADLFGMILMLGAGFDPYAGAGTLAKLSMVSGQAGLLAAAFDDLADPHGSFNTRIDLMFTTLTLACAQPVAASSCTLYRYLIHPNFPGTAPLSVTPPAGGFPEGQTQ
jgi:Peptidase family M48